MEAVAKPTNVYFENLTPTEGALVIFPCYPGYGMTLGNSLRRVLLSSVSGSAVTKVKFKSVDHEFSTIKGVKEDVIDIILNLKQARFKVHSAEPVKLSVVKKGKGTLKVGDFPKKGEIEAINKDLVLATLTDKDAEIEVEITVERGLGYVPVENREKDKLQLGEIAIDAVYTPLKTVSFKVENVRVGQRTDFDKITLNIKTDGSLSPREAAEAAAKILTEQFSVLEKIEEMPQEARGVTSTGELTAAKDDGSLDSLKLSTRALNALKEGGITTITELTKLTEAKLLALDGFGKTALVEVKEKLAKEKLALTAE